MCIRMMGAMNSAATESIELANSPPDLMGCRVHDGVGEFGI